MKSTSIFDTIYMGLLLSIITRSDHALTAVYIYFKFNKIKSTLLVTLHSNSKYQIKFEFNFFILYFAFAWAQFHKAVFR